MEDTIIEKANGKCSINFNNNCNCNVEKFQNKSNMYGILIDYIKYIIWFLLITVIIYKLLSIFI
jgi:hypothetical protein